MRDGVVRSDGAVEEAGMGGCCVGLEANEGGADEGFGDRRRSGRRWVGAMGDAEAEEDGGGVGGAGKWETWEGREEEEIRYMCLP